MAAIKRLPYFSKVPNIYVYVCVLYACMFFRYFFMTKRNNCCDFMFAYKNGKALSAKYKCSLVLNEFAPWERNFFALRVNLLGMGG